MEKNKNQIYKNIYCYIFTHIYIYIYIFKTEPLCYPAEINTIFKDNYTSIKKEKGKK